MCFSERVSWGAFFIGMITTFVLLLFSIETNNLYLTLIALGFFSVVMVQFFEALLWKGHTKIGSYGIIIATIMQPIIFGLLLLYPTNDLWKKALIGTLLIFYIIYILYSLFSNEKSNIINPNSECNNHLDYKPWSNFPFGGAPYLIMLILIFALLLPFELSSIVITLLIITLMLSILIYPCAVGSLWCFSAISLPVILIIYLLMNNYVFDGGSLVPRSS